eukprot:618019-Lingulodinium_polyedra.AAC.1
MAVQVLPPSRGTSPPPRGGRVYGDQALRPAGLDFTDGLDASRRRLDPALEVAAQGASRRMDPS